MMKKIGYILLSLIVLALSLPAQDDTGIPPNSILRNFEAFPTPRTNYRPGTVFRLDKKNTQFFVEDVRAVKSFTSEEGNLIGRMSFTKDELLSILNIEYDGSYITLQVEIKDALREFNEQTNIDRVFWENDKADELIVDDSSKYFIVRETVSAKEITYSFTADDYSRLITGKANLKETRARGDEPPDYPYYITKKFQEPRRVFYLKQAIGSDPYSG